MQLSCRLVSVHLAHVAYSTCEAVGPTALAVLRRCQSVAGHVMPNGAHALLRKQPEWCVCTASRRHWLWSLRLMRPRMLPSCARLLGVLQSPSRRCALLALTFTCPF